MTGWELNGGRGASATAITTTLLTHLALFSSARDQAVRKRSVVALTGVGTGRGERSYATGPPTTLGAVTVSPAFPADPDDTLAYEIWTPDGPHPDVIDAAIDRALREDCWYWRLTPITMVAGGDVGDELVLDSFDIDDDEGTRIWSAANAIPSLPELDMPDEYARRVIRVDPTASSGYMESLAIDVDPDDRDSWRIEALISAKDTIAGTGGGDARIIIRDLTNSTDITPEPSDGLQWTRRGFGLVEATFTLPATCNQIAIRLQVQNAAEFGDFAWVQLWETGRTQFSLPRRIATKKHIGQVYERAGTIFGQFRPRSFTGDVQRREAVGRGVMLTIHPAPGSKALFYYEKAPFPRLTSTPPVAADDDNQTWAELQWVRDAALWECYKYLTRRDEREDPNRWIGPLASAEVALRAAQVEYGIEPMIVSDSKKPRGRAVLKV